MVTLKGQLLGSMTAEERPSQGLHPPSGPVCMGAYTETQATCVQLGIQLYFCMKPGTGSLRRAAVLFGLKIQLHPANDCQRFHFYVHVDCLPRFHFLRVEPRASTVKEPHFHSSLPQQSFCCSKQLAKDSLNYLGPSTASFKKPLAVYVDICMYTYVSINKQTNKQTNVYIYIRTYTYTIC